MTATFTPAQLECLWSKVIEEGKWRAAQAEYNEARRLMTP